MNSRSVPPVWLLIFAVTACDGRNTGGWESTPGLIVDTVARGLRVPWAMAFTPDGRLLVTERRGWIRVIVGDSLDPEPWARLPVIEDGEAGLMGIAIAPDFAQTGHVLVVATMRHDSALVNRVVRLTDRDGRGTSPETVIDGIPAHALHAGDAIAFAPDGSLFVATGDARSPSHADDPTSLAGKVLRYTPAGGIPADNPHAGSPVYASGFRNVQGLAWSESGRLYATEHGPSGFADELYRRDNDELNAVRRGATYGWPIVSGDPPLRGVGRSVSPLATWTPAIAPSGLAVYTGTSLPAWRGSLFVAALRGESLYRMHIAEPATGEPRVTSGTVVLRDHGRLRAVAMGPDGHLYVTTSNRDGRGAPDPTDDLVLRLRGR